MIGHRNASRKIPSIIGEGDEIWGQGRADVATVRLRQKLSDDTLSNIKKPGSVIHHQMATNHFPGYH